MRTLSNERKRLSAADWVKALIKDANHGLNRAGEGFFVPRQIANFKIESPPLFFEGDFEKNSVNVLLGEGMSGKSTIIRGMLNAFGTEHEFFNSRDIMTIMKTYDSVGECLLVDDFFAGVDPDLALEGLRELKKLNTQVILTCRHPALQSHVFEALGESVDKIFALHHMKE